MKKNILIYSILISLLFSIVAVNASVSSVTTSSSASTATTGTSVVITASITDTTSETQSASIITSPSGITVSDPSGGQYQSVSLSTTPTSKTFTITAGAPDTYSYYVTSGGTPSTAGTIIFVNPSTLTVTGSPSSTTKTSGQTFTESITISNPSSSAVTTSYTLSCPSGFTCSGDPTSSSGTTINAGSSTTLSWTVTVGGTSSSATISLQLGDTSNAFSTSVTCSNCSTTTTTTDTTTTSPGGTTQVVKVTAVKGNVNITIPSIAAGKSSVVQITKTEDVAIRLITVYVKNSVNNIQITVTKLADKPASITQEITGKVYHYIQVDKNVSDDSVNQTAIRFEVEKSWISSNNINKSKVVLYRYSNNTWNKMQTTEMSEDTTTVLYEAISPGLSIFAISGEVTAAPTTPPEEVPAEEKKEEAPLVSLPTGGRGLLITIIVIVAVSAGVVIFLVKKGVIKFDKIFSKKSGWDELKKKYSRK
ncbi:MAG: PGF-pre-PGF domain-containing protein [Candidatus Aenigmarchaeota archaeon]|nr:PGF-pre-PGF domain-containing protein [Candidatus Aenigmarchaeota archaeon]